MPIVLEATLFFVGAAGNGVTPVPIVTAAAISPPVFKNSLRFIVFMDFAPMMNFHS
jgi:hypothetical protein